MLFDNIVKRLREKFSTIKDNRRKNTTYALTDLLSIAFAMFSLKDSSLSSFRDKFSIRGENLERIYGIEQLCGDTALRSGLDVVNPEELQALFAIPLAELRRSKGLEKRKILGKYLIVSIDGTGHYCSCTQSCPQCMVKKHRNGKISYYHQLLGAVMVHPGEKTVFPVACEAIVKQDGSSKNDCEQNAIKRLLPQVRKILPQDEVLTVLDALYATGPVVKALKKAEMHYIIGTKGKTYVDMEVRDLKQQKNIKEIEWAEKGVLHRIYYVNDLMLNGANQDINTNYFEYYQEDLKSKKQLFYSTWITDLVINDNTVKELVKAARSRWKIENETFNTLKNQGYHLEHNYGHGQKNLSTNFAILTFLAFLVDQVAQHLDTNFQKAKKVCRTLKELWSRVRAIFELIPAMSMDAIYRFIIKKRKIAMPALI